jgi:hypothetical protein
MAEYEARRKHLLLRPLAFTIEGLSTLPIEHRPDNKIAEMKSWLGELIAENGALSGYQLIALRRLEAMRRNFAGE